MTDALLMPLLTGLTVLAYLAALWVYRRAGATPLLLPVVVAVPIVILVLVVAGIPYPQYAQANAPLQWLIGPATVALAIPLYSQLGRLRRCAVPVMLALAAGAVTAIVSAVLVSRWMGASVPTQLSLAPKSLTMPIAMDIAGITGGIPALASIAVAITGIAGGMLGSYVFRALPSSGPEAQGFALGLTAHAIGVARALHLGPSTGAFAALGMGLNGIFSAFLLPVVWGLMG